MAPERPDIRTLREDDPEHDRLLAEGWTLVGESWGARLSLTEDADLGVYREAVVSVGPGYQIVRLWSPDVPEMRALETSIRPDYPHTPATIVPSLPEGLGDKLDTGKWLAFGARAADGALVAHTLMEPAEDRWEVDRTGVARAHRRKGLATAVKAASILATYDRGVRRWGTGGAAANVPSLAMNKALGFVLEPPWHSLQAPTA